jgi:hypothetical protein
MSEGKPARDLLGIAPYGEAIKIVVEKTTETAQQFLYEICKPAAAEFGLLLRDNVRAWRAKNLANIANKARELVTINAEGVQLRAHPRIVSEIVENGSWCDDETLQNMWAGLLASSCSATGTDESNLLFCGLLKQLTSAEARLLRRVFELVAVDFDARGVFFYSVRMTYEEVTEASGLIGKDIVEYHFNHLHSLGLFAKIGGNLITKRKDGMFDSEVFNSGDCAPIFEPQELAIHLFVRAEGYRISPTEYFKAQAATESRQK